MNKDIKTICYFGDYDNNYARNRVLIKGLKENGIKVIEVNDRSKNKTRKILNLIKSFRQLKEYELVIVGYSDSRFVVILAKILSTKPVIWDVFYSLYDSFILDRKLAPKISLKALYYWFFDWINCLFSDKILLDTKAHADFFVYKFKQNLSKIIIVPVGSDESVFCPKSFEPNNSFNVHFHGKFIPLQGVEHILKAAAILKDNPNIKFKLIGSGQTYQKNLKLKEELNLKNLEFLPRQSYNNLPEYINQSDISLGIFGTTEKATRVIPNKVYEAIACGKAVITMDSSAIREQFTNKMNIILCQSGNSQDLADKILKLKNNPELLKVVGKNGYNLFKDKFLPKVIAKQLISQL